VQHLSLRRWAGAPNRARHHSLGWEEKCARHHSPEGVGWGAESCQAPFALREKCASTFPAGGSGETTPPQARNATGVIGVSIRYGPVPPRSAPVRRRRFMTRAALAALALTAASSLAVERFGVPSSWQDGRSDSIHAAARAGDLATVRASSSRRQAGRRQDEAGRTPLHLAPQRTRRGGVVPDLARRRRERCRQQRLEPAPRGCRGRPGRSGPPPYGGKAAIDRRTSEAKRHSPWRPAAAPPAPSPACSRLEPRQKTANAYGAHAAAARRERIRQGGHRPPAAGPEGQRRREGQVRRHAAHAGGVAGFRDVVDLLLQAARRCRSQPRFAEPAPIGRRKRSRCAVHELAGLGVDPAARTERGGTLLHDAAGGGSAAIVGELLARSSR